MVDIHVELTGPENKKLRVEEEEKLVTSLREGVRQVKRHDPEPIKEAVRGYRQAEGENDRTFYKVKLLTAIEERLTKEPEKLVPYIADIIADFMINYIEIDEVDVDKSIAIRCRCKTTDGLLDLDKLIASGELDELFSLAMSCIINERVTASVSVSREAFKNCLKSLNADAG